MKNDFGDKIQELYTTTANLVGDVTDAVQQVSKQYAKAGEPEEVDIKKLKKEIASSASVNLAALHSFAEEMTRKFKTMRDIKTDLVPEEVESRVVPEKVRKSTGVVSAVVALSRTEAEDKV